LREAQSMICIVLRIQTKEGKALIAIVLRSKTNFFKEQ
jgi:hypothetical protein